MEKRHRLRFQVESQCLRRKFAPARHSPRRIPIAAEHRNLIGVAYKLKGVVYISTHMAAPFGATSSVHCWERAGHAISTIARKILKLACLRYVDDFFGVERTACLKHSMMCHARLVRALFGEAAIADRKLECGQGMAVLGVQMEAMWTGYRFALLCAPTLITIFVQC